MAPAARVAAVEEGHDSGEGVVRIRHVSDELISATRAKRLVSPDVLLLEVVLEPHKRPAERKGPDDKQNEHNGAGHGESLHLCWLD